MLGSRTDVYKLFRKSVGIVNVEGILVELEQIRSSQGQRLGQFKRDLDVSGSVVTFCSPIFGNLRCRCLHKDTEDILSTADRCLILNKRSVIRFESLEYPALEQRKQLFGEILNSGHLLGYQGPRSDITLWLWGRDLFAKVFRPPFTERPQNIR